jgi:hypothetical protein
MGVTPHFGIGSKPIKVITTKHLVPSEQPTMMQPSTVSSTKSMTPVSASKSPMMGPSATEKQAECHHGHCPGDEGEAKTTDVAVKPTERPASSFWDWSLPFPSLPTLIQDWKHHHAWWNRLAKDADLTMDMSPLAENAMRCDLIEVHVVL